MVNNLILMHFVCFIKMDDGIYNLILYLNKWMFILKTTFLIFFLIFIGVWLSSYFFKSLLNIYVLRLKCTCVLGLHIFV